MGHHKRPRLSRRGEEVEVVSSVSDKKRLSLWSVNSYNVKHIKIVCGQLWSVEGQGEVRLPAKRP